MDICFFTCKYSINTHIYEIVYKQILWFKLHISGVSFFPKASLFALVLSKKKKSLFALEAQICPHFMGAPMASIISAYFI